MDNSLDYIYKRHSVRKFTDEQVNIEDLKEIIKAAGAAPSGTNSQNWFFVAIRNEKTIDDLVNIIINKNDYIQKSNASEKLKSKLSKFLYYATLFKDAKTVVIAFSKPYNFFSKEDYKELDLTESQEKYIFNNSAEIQNVSAAIENLCLAASSLGYGSCWMTAPSFAYEEITNYLDMEDTNLLPVAIIPIGVPDGEVRSPRKKELDEILKIIE